VKTPPRSPFAKPSARHGAWPLRQKPLHMEYGDDWKDQLEQRARERKRMAELGIPVESGLSWEEIFEQYAPRQQSGVFALLRRQLRRLIRRGASC
jgi:hypothetical protein